MTWTVTEARSVICSKCGAKIGEPCTYRGRGAEKAVRTGRSHQPRIDAMLAARKRHKPGSKVDIGPARGQVIIHTDGSCLRNPGGPGGYAAIIKRDGREEILSGRDASTTNNRMEMMAAIIALEAIPAGSRVLLHSDSRYLINGFGWMVGWKRRGWRLKGGGPVANTDLWQRLDAAAQTHRIQWVWVKGHADNRDNNRADKIANSMARSTQPEGAVM